MGLFFLFYMVASAHGQIITTIAGGGTMTGEGIQATASALAYPTGVAVDRSGNVYIGLPINACIRKINTTGIITTVAGTGIVGYSGDGGPATAAKLSNPGGMVIDAIGNMYITDGNSTIRKVDGAGFITTIAGTGIAGDTGDGGLATAAEINKPNFITVDGAGNIYFTEDARVRKIDASGIITTFAGTGTMVHSLISGIPATSAPVWQAQGIAVDGAGNVYFVDDGNSCIRKVNTSGIITTIAGDGLWGYSGDGGPATAAWFYGPSGLALDGYGNVYFNDGYPGYDNRIRKVSTTGIITTVAGTGYGFGGDGGPATAANFKDLLGLAIDCGGNFYIGDESNNRVRKITNIHRPFFSGEGHSLSVCVNSGPASVNALLAAIDADTLITIDWSLIVSPAHGAVAGMTYSGLTTGDTVTPTGLTYTPATGYTGSDSFRVAVGYCGYLSDTVTVYVTVSPHPVVAAVNGADSVCKGSMITLSSSTSGGVWSASSGVSVGTATGVVTGLSAGLANISYTVTISGCSTSVGFPVKVVVCPSWVETTPNCMNIKVYPNPANDELNITGVPENMKYRILNMAGVNINQGVLHQSNNTLSMQHFSPGIYILEIKGIDGQRNIIRLVKE